MAKLFASETAMWVATKAVSSLPSIHLLIKDELSCIPLKWIQWQIVLRVSSKNHVEMIPVEILLSGAVPA